MNWDTKKNLVLVVNLLNDMKKTENVKLKLNNPKLYRKKLEKNHEDLYENHFFLFSKILKGDDISNLFKIFSLLEKVKKGKLTKREAELKFNMGLADRYLPKKFQNDYKPKMEKEINKERIKRENNL